MKSARLAALLAAVVLPASALAKPTPAIPAHPEAEAQALDLAKASIAIRSVAGPGNRTGEVAALYRDALLKAGFAPEAIHIEPLGDTHWFMATWTGSDPKLKPLVISGHMDVVEAKPADWQRDPFTPVIENGYLYGRGATDMKFDGAVALASLIELKRSGYKPKRTIVIEYSGDEETTMRTSAVIAEKLKDAQLVLNIDGGGGALDEKTGAPLYFTWQGAEKTYADFELTVTNPGGHSSMPRPANAIAELSRALGRIAAYHFKPEMNPISRGYFTAAAKLQADPQLRAAMEAFVANPDDPKALEVLRADPSYVGKIATTCVPTTVSGGHALNALPQRAVANINCRIFPGHSPAAIMAELEQVAAEPSVKFRDVTTGSVATDASPLDPALAKAIESALHAVYPGVPVFPAVASGASDSMWFRHQKVASYGVAPTFIRNSEDFSHGLNERIPLANIRPSIDFYLLLLKDLSR
ncbi:MAG: M20/M25/M40 family metallo-hydrolase [Proteobacteria bacterium]|nr:M20/M25/M40 family metallo-hydrolase [Pseudomonadota bacterium]